MWKTSPPIISVVVLLVLLPRLAQANSGDFSGGVAIGTSYAGVDTAPTNGLLVQGVVGIGTTSPGYDLDVFDSNSGTDILRAYSNTSGLAYLDVVNGNSGTGANGSIIRLITENSAGTGQTAVNMVKYANGYFEIYDTDSAGVITFGTGSTEAMRISSSGNVGIGNTSPSYLLHVGSSSASGIVAELQNSSGACTHNPSASSETVTCSSDARLKSDIQDSKNALTWIDDIRVRDFTVKATGERRTGAVAQELMLKHPEMVHKNKTGLYAVDEPNPWMLVKTIQELHGIVSMQQDEIDGLKNTLLQLAQKKQTTHDDHSKRSGIGPEDVR